MKLFVCVHCVDSEGRRNETPAEIIIDPRDRGARGINLWTIHDHLKEYAVRAGLLDVINVVLGDAGNGLSVVRVYIAEKALPERQRIIGGLAREAFELV